MNTKNQDHRLKIVIQYDQCDESLDPASPPSLCLDNLLSAFTGNQVHTILNQTVRLFREMIDLWNQREMASRRELERAQESGDDAQEA